MDFPISKEQDRRIPPPRAREIAAERLEGTNQMEIESRMNSNVRSPRDSRSAIITLIAAAVLLVMTGYTYAGSPCDATYIYGTPRKLDCSMFEATCGEIASARDSGESKKEAINDFHATSVNDQECRMVDECANRVWGPWKDKSRSEVDSLAYELCTEHPLL
jgi:hypothetical protein